MKSLKILIILLFISANLFAAKVDTIHVESKIMNKTIPNAIIIPDSYKNDSKFPVIYLLHGAGGSFMSWLNKMPKQLKDLSDQYKVIIVCPDAGKTSWYFDSPVDPTYCYESYVSKELVKYIDTNFKTIANRKGRAIAGLSMGGHGAFYLAFRHQDIWGAAGSMSGGLDIRPFPNNWDLPKRLGKYAKNKGNWENNAVINLVHLLDGKSLKLVFECGTSDFFYDCNKRMHQLLLERKIPHDYTERPGAHNWDYWPNAFTNQMIFFNDFFQEGKQ